MTRYETLILTVPEITKDETSALELQVQNVIKKARGTTVSFDRWGKYRLAYPVRKNEYGVYFLTRFEVDDEQSSELINNIRHLFAVKYPELVMRHMTTYLEPNQPLSYQKPDSLEDTPRDVDSFLREHKISGLSSVASPESKITSPKADDFELEDNKIDEEE